MLCLIMSSFGVWVSIPCLFIYNEKKSLNWEGSFPCWNWDGWWTTPWCSSFLRRTKFLRWLLWVDMNPWCWIKTVELAEWWDLLSFVISVASGWLLYIMATSWLNFVLQMLGRGCEDYFAIDYLVACIWLIFWLI